MAPFHARRGAFFPRGALHVPPPEEPGPSLSFTPLAWHAPSSIQQSGGVVTSWTDTSPNGHDLSIVNGSPVYNATGVDDGPCVVFDGTNDWLSSPAFDASGTNVIACFARVLFDSDAPNDNGIAVIANSSGVTNDFDNPNGAPLITFGGLGAGQIQLRTHRGGSDVNVILNKGAAVSVGGVLDASRTVYDLTDDTSATAAASLIAFGTTSQLLVGARQYFDAKQNPLKGRISAMIWLDFTPSSGQIAEIQAVLEASPPPSPPPAERPVDGGPDYYDQFTNSFETDGSFFPIGIWLDYVGDQGDIDDEQAVGINTYVSLQRHSDLSLVVSNGMCALLQDEWRTDGDPSWVTPSSYVLATAWTGGWNIGDEADMIYGPGSGPGQGFTFMQDALDAVPDSRVTFANYAKGVLFWEENFDAVQFMNNYQHITAHDVYWMGSPYDLFNGGPETSRITQYDGGPQRESPLLSESEVHRPANYGYMIDRMRYLDGLDSARHPQWIFIEVGWPLSEGPTLNGRRIEPEELQAAVLHSLIAGARGIIYFNHSFNNAAGVPGFYSDSLNDPDYADTRVAIVEINALITSLAQVLNAPFDDGYVTQDGAVRVMAKIYSGTYYLFAANREHASTSPTFTLSSAIDGTATVIGESRTIPIVDGEFSDTFTDGNAWHIYRIDLP